MSISYCGQALPCPRRGCDEIEVGVVVLHAAGAAWTSAPRPSHDRLVGQVDPFLLAEPPEEPLAPAFGNDLG